jgi:hypothetical protein
MRLVVLAVFAGLFASVALPGLAAEHAFMLHNNLTKPITSFKVKGGEVSGFKKIAPGARITFNVTVPGNECTAAVSARVGENRRDGRVNLCDQGGYVLTPAEGGTKFLPLSQVMLR